MPHERCDTINASGRLCLLLVAAACGTSGESSQDAFAALVFSKTAGFRHASIPAGVRAVTTLGAEHGFRVDASEDAAVFSDAGLAKYRVVIFLNTTGDVLAPDQEAALERFIRNGRGFVGVHSATDTEYDWPWYGQLVGTYFDHHPEIQTATLRVVDGSHPSTSGMSAAWERRDEWYDFRSDPGSRVRVLITIDETSYTGGRMGANHPIAWYHEYDGGRAWYTAMGHTEESYSEPRLVAHLLGGIQWAAGDGGR